MRAYGKLKKSVWADPSWVGLTGDAQHLYVYLVTQPTTDTAGVFPVQFTKWAKAASDLTAERVTAAAKVLEHADWIVLDYRTEEGLIRRYIADDEAGDNIFKGALNRALLAQSGALRATLLDEILKLDRPFGQREQELIDELAAGLPMSKFSVEAPAPSSTATTQAFEYRSKTVGMPFEDPSDAVRTPSERRSNGVLDEGAGERDDECDEPDLAEPTTDSDGNPIDDYGPLQ